MSTMTPPRARRTPRAPNRFSSDMSVADSIEQSGNANDPNSDGSSSRQNSFPLGKIKLRPIVREPLKVKLPKLRRLQAPQQTKEKQPTPKPHNADIKIHKIKLPSFAKKAHVEKVRTSITLEERKNNAECKSTEKLTHPTSQSEHSPPKSNSISDNFQAPNDVNQGTTHNEVPNNSLSTDADTSSKGNTSLSSEDTDSSGMQIIVEKVNNQQNENGIRCPCGVNDDIGVMVECEKCSTWQHGHCINVGREEDAYEGYVCAFCISPQSDACESLSQLTVGDKLLAFFDELESVLRANRDDTTEDESHVIKGRSALLTKEDLMDGIHDLKRVMRSLDVKWALLTSQKYETELRIWQNPFWAGKSPEIKTDAGTKTFYFIDRCKANLVMNIRNIIEKLDFRSKVFLHAIECRSLLDTFGSVSSTMAENESIHSSYVLLQGLRVELEEYKKRLKQYSQQN